MMQDEQWLWAKQLKRCIFLITLPVSVTVVPSVLAELCGAYGIFAIALGFLLGAVVMHTGETLIRPVWVRIILAILCLLQALLGFYFLTRYTNENLARTISCGFILAILALLALVFVKNWKTSFEKCIFLTIWPVVLTLGILWIFAAQTVRFQWILGGFQNTASFHFTGLWLGTLLVFFTILCAVLLPAALARLNGQTIHGIGLEKTMAVCGGVQIVSFLIYLGVFQVPALGRLRTPYQNLISMVRMPGGCLERQDAILGISWFLSLFFYTVVSLWMSIGLLQKRRILSILLVCIAANLTGCGQPDLEKRAFPLVLAIDGDEKGACAYTFAYENVNPSEQSLYEHGDDEIPAASYQQAYDTYLKKRAVLLDDSHVVAILVDEKLLKNQSFWDELFRDFYDGRHFSWNTAVFVYDADHTDLSDWREKTGERLGSYLGDLLEKQSDLQGYETATLGDLYLNRINGNGQLYLPQLLDEKEPVVTGYLKIGGE